MKKYFLTFITSLILVSFLGQNTLNAASSAVASSLAEVTVGQTITVTVNMSFDVPTYAVEFHLSYDDSVFELLTNGDSYSGSAGILKVVDSAGGVMQQSFTLEFKAVSSGSGDFTVSNAYYAADNEMPISGSAVTVTSKPVTVGDVNDDGITDIRDMVHLKKYVCGITQSVGIGAADMNGDGNINSLDISALQKYLIN